MSFPPVFPYYSSSTVVQLAWLPKWRDPEGIPSDARMRNRKLGGVFPALVGSFHREWRYP